MSTTSVTNSYSVDDAINNTISQNVDRNTGELGKDDFLQILVTQLQYQDPLKPMEDKEFISQMAQFSSLEQMQNLNTTFSTSKAFNMIGKYVVAATTDANGNFNQVEGIVQDVKMQNGKTYVVVNGTDVLVDDVSEVMDGYERGGSLAQYTSLIGRNVSANVINSSTGDVVPVEGTVKSLESDKYYDYAVLNDVNLDVTGVKDMTAKTDEEWNTALNDSIGKEITVNVQKDGKNVEVTGKLDSYKVEDGKISVKLDGVYVLVMGVYGVSG